MKNKPITIIAVTILILAGIVFFFIKPVVANILKSWKDLETSRQNIQSTEQKKQVIQDLKNNPQLKAISEIALKYIPTQSGQSDLVIELTAIAQKNNLTIDQTTINQKSTGTTPKATPDDTTGTKTIASPAPTTSGQTKSSSASEIQFTMNLSGSYGDFVNFLQAIDTSTRLMAIKTINITRSTTTTISSEQTQTPQASTFGFQLTGSAYYKADVTIDKTQDNLKVSEATIKKFLNLKSYGLPINLKTEAGFGRVNPFDGY